MRLSIVIPTNRDNLLAYSTLMHACSWSSDQVEIVVRDNSGSSRKHALLRDIDRVNCNIQVVPPCDVNTNFFQSLLLARGDFVLFMGDDDSSFDRGVAAIAAKADECFDDMSVVGITGAYALEEQPISHIVNYPNIDSADVVARMGGYLGYQGPNLIFYSAVRRQAVLDTFEFFDRHPFRLPFQDHFFSLIYLLSGRFLNVGRLAFIYDNANWDAADTGVKSDLKAYLAAGLDPIIRQLHWILCGFEGASIILKTRFGLQHPVEQRQIMANQWFEVMFRRFAGERPNGYGSSLEGLANGVRERLLAAAPRFSLDVVLDDICAFITLFSQEKADAYREFWTSVSATTAQ